MADDKEHPDAAQDAEQLRPIVEGLVKAVEMLANKIDQLEGGHGALEKLVVDDLIGSIHTMYKTNMRNGRIESLKSKYGEHLNDHFGALSHLVPEGTDHWGALHDMTEGMEGDELDNHVKGLAEGLKAKLGKVRGLPSEVKVESAEVAPAAEEAPAEAPKEPETKKKKEEEPEPKKKSKDELITEGLKKSKSFKLR